MLIYSRLRFPALIASLAVCVCTVPSLAKDNTQNDEAVVVATSSTDEERPEPKKPRWTLKPNISVFWPGDSRVQDRFGDTWTMIGLSIDYRDDDRSKDRLQFQIDGIRRKSGGDHVRVYPVGLKYTRRVNDSHNFSPYFGGTASFCMADVKSQVDNVDTGFRSAGFGGSAFAGANIGMNLKVEATYHLLPSVKGFDLSGLSLGATLQF